jgi:hypothetical protein
MAGWPGALISSGAGAVGPGTSAETSGGHTRAEARALWCAPCAGAWGGGAHVLVAHPSRRPVLASVISQSRREDRRESSA